MPLAPNAVRLDTQASGLLFADKAGSATMKRAAELTLQSGYSHFRFEQASTAQGSELAGVSSFGSATVQGASYGNGFSATGFGSNSVTPIYRPTSNVGVTVIMFHSDEAGAKGAFDAAEVLKRANS
jgi:hypothetical protein